MLLTLGLDKDSDSFLKYKTKTMWKDVKCIMLPTKEKSDICLSNGNHLQYLNDNSSKNINNHFEGVYQNLYIISLDEEIKEGEWYLTTNFHSGNLEIVMKSNTSFSKDEVGNFRFKILAATDRNLKVKEYQIAKYVTAEYLSQITQQFVEKWIAEYNRGNVLEDLQVEYEDKLHYENTIYKSSNKQTLKISKDNFLSIRKKENKLYTEEDVEYILIEYARSDYARNSRPIKFFTDYKRRHG